MLVIFTLLTPMLRDGMWKGHDGSSHILRLHNTLSALEEGQYPPVINSAQENAFGYSWNLFYPPLSAYLAAGTTLGMKALGVSSPFAGMKLAWLCIVLATAASMYFFLKRVFRSHFAATVGTVLYITAPYFVSCVYIRFALGEIMLFVFLPLLAAGLHSVFYEQGEKNYLITIGTLGIILSNIPASIILLIFLAVFSLLHAKHFLTKRILAQLSVNVALTCGIAAFFYVPFFEHWRIGNITAFAQMTGASLASLQNEGIDILRLILPRKTVRMFFYYGFPILFFAVWLFLKTPQKRGTKLLAFFCLILSFAMSKWVPWPHIIPSALENIKYLQFPWRMLGLALFLLCTLSAYNALTFFKKETRPAVLLAVAACCSLAALFVFPSGRYAAIERPETHTADYLPQKSLPFKKEFASMKAEPVVLSGPATIRHTDKSKSRLAFSIENALGESVVELPYFAYLGYTASLMTHDGKTHLLPLRESDKGLWSATLPANAEGRMTVSYTGTPASRGSYRLSQASLVLLACYVGGHFWIYGRRKTS